MNLSDNHGSTGMRPGEAIETYVKRLEAQNKAQQDALALATAAKAKNKFGLSPKGVFTYSAGPGFPASLSPAVAAAICQDTDFHKYVAEMLDKARALRKERVETDEYKKQAAILSASRKAYALKVGAK